MASATNGKKGMLPPLGASGASLAGSSIASTTTSGAAGGKKGKQGKGKGGKRAPALARLAARPQWVGSPSSTFELTWSSYSNRHIRNHQNPPTLTTLEGGRTTIVGAPDKTGASAMSDLAARTGRQARAAVMRGDDLLLRCTRRGQKRAGAADGGSAAAGGGAVHAAPDEELLALLQAAWACYTEAGDEGRLEEARRTHGRVMGDRANVRAEVLCAQRRFAECVGELKLAARYYRSLEGGGGLGGTQPQRADEARAGTEAEFRNRQTSASDGARLARARDPRSATASMALADGAALLASAASRLRRSMFVEALALAELAERSTLWAAHTRGALARGERGGAPGGEGGEDGEGGADQAMYRSVEGVGAGGAPLPVPIPPHVLPTAAAAIEEANEQLATCRREMRRVIFEQQDCVGRGLLGRLADATLTAAKDVGSELAPGSATAAAAQEGRQRGGEGGDGGGADGATAQEAAAPAPPPPQLVRRHLLGSLLAEADAQFRGLLQPLLRGAKLEQTAGVAAMLRRHGSIAAVGDEGDEGDEAPLSESVAAALAAAAAQAQAEFAEAEATEAIGAEAEAAGAPTAAAPPPHTLAGGGAAAADAGGDVDDDDGDEAGGGGDGPSSSSARPTVSGNDAHFFELLLGAARIALQQRKLDALATAIAADPHASGRQPVLLSAARFSQAAVGHATDSLLTLLFLPLGPGHGAQSEAVRARLAAQCEQAAEAAAATAATARREQQRLGRHHHERLRQDELRRSAILEHGGCGWHETEMARVAVEAAIREAPDGLMDIPAVAHCVEVAREAGAAMDARLRTSVVSFDSTDASTDAALSSLEAGATECGTVVAHAEKVALKAKAKLELLRRTTREATRRAQLTRQLERARELAAAGDAEIATGPYGLADAEHVASARAHAAELLAACAFELARQVPVEGVTDAETDATLAAMAKRVVLATEAAELAHVALKVERGQLEAAKARRDEEEAVERQAIAAEVLAPAQEELAAAEAELEAAGPAMAAVLRQTDAVVQALAAANSAVVEAGHAVRRPVETKYSATMVAMLRIVRESCVECGELCDVAHAAVLRERARLTAELEARRAREGGERAQVVASVLTPAAQKLAECRATVAAHEHGLAADEAVAAQLADAEAVGAAAATKAAKELDVASEETMAAALEELRSQAEAAAAVADEAVGAAESRRRELDRLFNARANKDKAERDKIRNRTLGMARQQLRMTHSVITMNTELETNEGLSSAIAAAQAQIEGVDAKASEPCNLATDDTLGKSRSRARHAHLCQHSCFAELTPQRPLPPRRRLDCLSHCSRGRAGADGGRERGVSRRAKCHGPRQRAAVWPQGRASGRESSSAGGGSSSSRVICVHRRRKERE